MNNMKGDLGRQSVSISMQSSNSGLLLQSTPQLPIMNSNNNIDNPLDNARISRAHSPVSSTNQSNNETDSCDEFDLDNDIVLFKMTSSPHCSSPSHSQRMLIG